MSTYVLRRFAPPTDIIEHHDRLVIVSEIAGMQPEDFQLTLTKRRLVISGRRRSPLEALLAGARQSHQIEIGYGEFRIEVMLPWSADVDHVTATYRDGFLQVELPRHPDRKISVMEGGTRKQGLD